MEGIPAFPINGERMTSIPEQSAAVVEIFPGTDGLLHISEIAENRIKLVTDELNEGDQIRVKVIGIEGNKIKLSRKAVLKELRDQMKAKEQ